MPTRVEDALDTMRVVEAAYLSSERGGEPLALASVETTTGRAIRRGEIRTGDAVFDLRAK